MTTPYQPKTGAKCSCKRGVQRDNCPACEGTGWMIDFAAIRARRNDMTDEKVTGASYNHFLCSTCGGPSTTAGCLLHTAAPRMLETLAALTSLCVTEDGAVGFNIGAGSGQATVAQVMAAINAARALVAEVR